MAKTNCDYKRIIGPSGIWKLEDLIGATVKISSMPISNMRTIAIDSSQGFTVEYIDFRVSLDGKAITVVKLKRLEDLVFTLKDLIFTGVILKEEEED